MILNLIIFLSLLQLHSKFVNNACTNRLFCDLRDTLRKLEGEICYMSRHLDFRSYILFLHLSFASTMMFSMWRIFCFQLLITWKNFFIGIFFLKIHMIKLWLKTSFWIRVNIILNMLFCIKRHIFAFVSDFIDFFLHLLLSCFDCFD